MQAPVLFQLEVTAVQRWSSSDLPKCGQSPRGATSLLINPRSAPASHGIRKVVSSLLRPISKHLFCSCWRSRPSNGGPPAMLQLASTVVSSQLCPSPALIQRRVLPTRRNSPSPRCCCCNDPKPLLLLFFFQSQQAKVVVPSPPRCRMSSPKPRRQSNFLVLDSEKC